MKRLLLLIVTLLSMAVGVSAQNAIACAGIAAEGGQRVELPIELTNQADLAIVGISFTLTLPEGVTVEETDGEPDYTLLDDRLASNRFSVYTAKYADGSWGFRIIPSTAGAALKGTSGAFMTLPLNIAKGMKVGDYSVGISDNKLSVRGNNYSVTSLPVANSSSTLAVRNNLTYTEITLSSDGESTYCCEYDLDFSQTPDICAYIASGYYPQNGCVLLTRVLEVPAGTGIVVKGDAGTYRVPFGTSSAYYLNLLVGNIEPLTAEPEENGLANLFLTNGADGLGFYHFSTAFALEANRARLQLPVGLLESTSHGVKILYEEDADALRDAEFLTPENIAVYDLGGRKLSTPRQGVNIIRKGDGSADKVIKK